jgi:multiple sugar transport system permease protein
MAIADRRSLPERRASTLAVLRGNPLPRPGRGRRWERFVQWMFIVPAGAYVLFYFGYPIVQNVVMSFQDYSTKTFFTGEAPWVGFANYVSVVTSGVFGTSLINTFLFCLGAIAGQFVLGLALATFFRRKFPLNTVLRALLLIPWLVPLVASSAVWKWIFSQDDGVLNQTLLFLHVIGSPIPWLSSPNVALVAVVIVGIWVGLPLNATLFYSGLQAIPEELYEAGSLDGATGWKSFRYITWPNLKPVVSVVLVLGVVYTLKALDIILGLTGGGPANSTLTLAMYSYHSSFEQYTFGIGAAISNFIIVISLVFSLIYLRIDRHAVDE